MTRHRLSSRMVRLILAYRCGRNVALTPAEFRARLAARPSQAYRDIQALPGRRAA